ncbi:MAG: hypothetical protein NPIRA05_13310 [Nitrospirales bacterium]|nr:MAG: hypothetical protein NPIRA05_13310 [Nitrospirales bacterium]
MYRRASCQLLLLLCSFIVVILGGCSSNGKIQRAGLEESPTQNYGWWVGHGGEQTAVDIGFDGKGIQIRVQRSYLSHARIDSPVGKRWTHNYLMHIQNASGRAIKLFKANGRESKFLRTNPGEFTSEVDDQETLTQNGDGTHSLQDSEGTIYGFNRKGRLMHVQGHQYGNTISLAYGANGYLDSISDAQGHLITFNYDLETHRLASIRDGQGRSAMYQHDDVGNLISVTNAEGITSEYSYDRQSHLVGVTFP